MIPTHGSNYCCFTVDLCCSYTQECVVIYHKDSSENNTARDAEISEVLKVTGNKSGKAIVREVNLAAEKVLF